MFLVALFSLLLFVFSVESVQSQTQQTEVGVGVEQVVIFAQYATPYGRNKLQNSVNMWLNQNSGMDITRVLQTEDRNDITISIFYKKKFVLR